MASGINLIQNIVTVFHLAWIISLHYFVIRVANFPKSEIPDTAVPSTFLPSFPFHPPPQSYPEVSFPSGIWGKTQATHNAIFMIFWAQETCLVSTKVIFCWPKCKSSLCENNTYTCYTFTKLSPWRPHSKCTVQNRSKYLLLTDAQNLCKLLKSVVSAGKLFHILTTLVLKNRMMRAERRSRKWAV